MKITDIFVKVIDTGLFQHAINVLNINRINRMGEDYQIIFKTGVISYSTLVITKKSGEKLMKHIGILEGLENV